MNFEFHQITLFLLRTYCLGDLYHQSTDGGEELPDWVKNERDQFKNYRDKNGDGFMDVEEVCMLVHMRYYSFGSV